MSFLLYPAEKVIAMKEAKSSAKAKLLAKAFIEAQGPDRSGKQIRNWNGFYNEFPDSYKIVGWL